MPGLQSTITLLGAARTGANCYRSALAEQGFEPNIPADTRPALVWECSRTSWDTDLQPGHLLNLRATEGRSFRGLQRVTSARHTLLRGFAREPPSLHAVDGFVRTSTPLG